VKASSSMDAQRRRRQLPNAAKSRNRRDPLILAGRKQIRHTQVYFYRQLRCDSVGSHATAKPTMTRLLVSEAKILCFFGGATRMHAPGVIGSASPSRINVPLPERTRNTSYISTCQFSEAIWSMSRTRPASVLAKRYLPHRCFVLLTWPGFSSDRATCVMCGISPFLTKTCLKMSSSCDTLSKGILSR